MASKTPGQSGPAYHAATPRALQELAETVQRSRLGGPFYVMAWGIAGFACDLPDRAPGLFLAIALAFAALTWARLHVKAAAPGASPDLIVRRLRAIWAVVLVNSALWGFAAGWLIWITHDETARTVAAISSYAFSTAFAHNFAMRRQRSLLAILLIYLPTMAAYVAGGARIEFVVINVFYLAYVVLALRRSHQEYLQRLDLEDELRRQRDLFEQQSQRDSLTALPNRRYFTAMLARWVDEARAAPLPFALLILDLDWFKAVNDRHGHAVGDACLRAFAEQLQSAFDTPQDVVARLGGEEFAVLIRDCAVSIALQRADAFRQALAGRPLPIAGLALGLTVSIGVGGFEPSTHADGDALYLAVDQALYRAKASGRNTVRQAESVE
jgi:diguanylate cyclase (GGDEF)-like protein